MVHSNPSWLLWAENECAMNVSLTKRPKKQFKPVQHSRPQALTPCWSVIDFWKNKFEKSSSTNWIFNLQKSILKLIFVGYTGSKNTFRNRLKIQLVKLDFSNLIFQKSCTDQQEVWPFWFCQDFRQNRISKNLPIYKAYCKMKSRCIGSEIELEKI